MTGPNPYFQPEDPADPPTVAVQPPRRPRFNHRGTVLGAALLAVLVVGGVVVALLMPGGGLGARIAAFDGAGSPSDVDQLTAAAAPSAPAAPPAGPRHGAGQHDGPKALGDDTLLVGTVVSMAPGTVAVAEDNGPTLTVHTNDITKVLGAGKKGLAAVAAGDRVVVRVTGTGDAATAVSLATPKARVTGTVTAVNGDTVAVLRADGLSQTVNVAAVNPKPAVGDLILVSGKADGATITADRSRPLPKAS